MSFAESQVLNKVLATGDMSIISNNGITEDVFHTYKDEFRYIWDVYKEYGCPPDKASFLVNFLILIYLMKKMQKHLLIDFF